MRHMLRPLLATALLIVATPVLAADSAARLSFGPQQITWEPQIASERTVLTVSAPNGKVARQEFKGTPATFELSTAAADGTYHWELQILTATQPRQRRAQGGEEAMAARAQGPILSGTFVVKDGQIVSPDLKEAPHGGGVKPQSGAVTGMDVVTPDDMIIQGSLCVGLDCVNNESFGFDTIRLKENNTRIKFDDTSTSAGFSANDWQLTANDSASGGASKFSIEDITGSKVPFTITGGAATNSIFVDSTGRVGLRTSTPVLDLHIATSNTPAIRLEQNNSGGFTAQTWDIAGNEANFFVRDVTGGSRLPFRIRPGAPTSSIDISSDGDVGIGTASPDNRLDIRCNAAAAACGKISNSSATGFSGWEFTEEAGTVVANFSVDNAANTFRLNATNSFPIVILTNSSERIRFPAPGGNVITAANGAFLSAGGVWQDGSSRATKRDIADLSETDALSALRGLTPVSYYYKAEPGEQYLGFIAEDVPELVASSGRKSLNPMDMVAVLTKVVQTQQKTIDDLNARLAALEKHQQ